MHQYLHGVDRVEELGAFFANKRLGLLSNQTGVNSRLESTADILNEKYTLTALFAAEHGFRGIVPAGESVDGYIDKKTGIPVNSLFGQEDSGAFSGIDCFVVDIQDIGSRFYTYIYTMAKAMAECAEHGIPVVVLDRFNPLGLTRTEGTLLDERFSSDVGMYELPGRHAMTIGEFARYINTEKRIGCELRVLPCRGLRRDMDYRDINIPWIMPSPNIPSWETALCFTGTVLFEGTNVSEGRGTTKPFELIGAPWLKADETADIMNRKNLGGVIFRSTYFTPYFSKYKGEVCNAIQLHITDADAFEPFKSGVILLDTIRRLHSEFEFIKLNSKCEYFIDELFGKDDLRKKDFEPESFIRSEKDKIEKFSKKTEKYRIYE